MSHSHLNFVPSITGMMLEITYSCGHKELVKADGLGRDVLNWEHAAGGLCPCCEEDQDQAIRDLDLE